MKIVNESKLTAGEEYIKSNHIKELSYNDAIEQSKEELIKRGIKSTDDVYDNEEIFDSPVFPANAELYDEFVDDLGFDTAEYFLFIARRMREGIE